MKTQLRVMIIDASTGFYRIRRYDLGDFYGPVDLGLHLSSRINSLNIGTGLLAGSIFPGSNRLIFNGFSPAWGGFYISSMGGAGLVFDNLGLNLLSITGKASRPSILYLNRLHGEEIQCEIEPVDLEQAWFEKDDGIYGLFRETLDRYGSHYEKHVRILATGPASRETDCGAIGSVPVIRGELTDVDTWAGRGGFGSRLLQEHGIASIIYGGTFLDEDFRDRKVADTWFIDRYEKKLAAKDLEATTKYRYDEKFNTGGTFGVNYTKLKGDMISFNYRSLFMGEEKRLDIHDRLVLQHYLKQFNEETIDKKQQKTCGEPCAAVCKKMNGHFKKDYEPYQALGPLCGIFDQRAAEKANRRADSYGFDAISIGGVVAWLMECIDQDLLTPEDCGTDRRPLFDTEGFDVVKDSMHNAEIAIDILEAVIHGRGIVDLSEGARKFGRRLSRSRGVNLLDRFVYTAFGRKGWMVPNQYWTPGVLSPMAIMGKYYMYYGGDFIPPRELGRRDAERFRQELVLDNMGICRFHRAWAEDMVPEIMETLYGLGKGYVERTAITATRINSRNASVYWESERNIDFILEFMKKKRDIEGSKDEDLLYWLDFFEKDRHEAAFSFWYEIHKGITESLKEY